MIDPPLRVEQALRLLPDVDALTPLRAFLISTSRSSEPDAWDTSEPYRTVGRRLLRLGDLRRRIPEALARAQSHLAALYEAVLEALEHERAGNMPDAVRALLRAGTSEEGAGRHRQAHAWYAHALGLAEALRDRRPEIEALCALGRVAIAAGRPPSDAEKEYYRAYVLADAELDHDGSIEACQGMGDVNAAQGNWAGAESWYTRGLRLADGDPRRKSQLLLRLARAASERGDQERALQRLAQAREGVEAAAGPLELAGVLEAQGAIELRRSHPAEAAAAFREGLASLAGAGSATLEVELWIGLTRALMGQERWREAEDEARRGEELAIMHNLTLPLARLYVIFGNLRGAQGDEDGFVFFEKSIELCRGVEGHPRQEGETYLEYGRFRRGVGDREGARGCFERALEIFTTLQYNAGRDLVTAEIESLPPA